ncbi:MAG TPA: aldose 1-epimerase [Solirubrobacterales bacterium]|nr:aldose 1-epimerase [Solirubrobacterales bacterium]
MAIAGEIEGIPVLTLTSESAGGIEVAFAPGAGMIGCSLRHRGEELLGQRGGLRRYAEAGKTMGIPLLYPWANRLGERRFAVAGGEVDLDLTGLRLSTDAAGLPMHGLLAGAAGWEVLQHEPSEDGGVLAARFDFASQPDLLAAFPFPHQIGFEATLGGAELTVSVTVRPSAGVAVPVAFGFHPYLRLPNVPRAEWEVEIPVRERILLDDRMLPTGAEEPVEIASGPLGARTFDDAFRAPAAGAPFVLAGGGRRLELRFDAGYPFAQVYAPGDDEVIAIEPMTAPANALLSGRDLPLVAPGDTFAACFTLAIS